MSQAKTLTERELRKVLSYIALRKHATRNRAMLLVTHWSGMRVGEVAALRIGDPLILSGLFFVSNLRWLRQCLHCLTPCRFLL